VGNLKLQIVMANLVIHRLEAAQDTRLLYDEEHWLWSMENVKTTCSWSFVSETDHGKAALENDMVKGRGRKLSFVPCSGEW
jgi:hypothetical protein